MYVVLGASGNTGSVVAEILLAKGEKVRVVGRDPRRLEHFSKKGAEVFAADVLDAAALARALAGAKAAYLLIPPNIGVSDALAYEDQVSDALTVAVTSSGLKYAVVLSSEGADKPAKTGPVVGLHHLEQKLDGIASLNAVYLRAGYFMENLLPQIGVIQSFGFITGPVKDDLPLPMIATRDIGAVAAEELLRLNVAGKRRRELQGPRDVTYQQVAKIVGAAIGKPDLSYRKSPDALLKPALMQMGMSASMAELLLEMAEALNTGYMRMLEPRSPETTTPTTVEQFVADTFVPAFQGKAAGA